MSLILRQINLLQQLENFHPFAFQPEKQEETFTKKKKKERAAIPRRENDSLWPKRIEKRKQRSERVQNRGKRLLWMAYYKVIRVVVVEGEVEWGWVVAGAHRGH